jgi:hypothetical protein
LYLYVGQHDAVVQCELCRIPYPTGKHIFFFVQEQLFPLQQHGWTWGHFVEWSKPRYNKCSRISLLGEPKCGSYRRCEKSSRYQRLVRMSQEDIRNKFWSCIAQMKQNCMYISWLLKEIAKVVTGQIWMWFFNIRTITHLSQKIFTRIFQCDPHWHPTLLWVSIHVSLVLFILSLSLYLYIHIYTHKYT